MMNRGVRSEKRGAENPKPETRNPKSETRNTKYTTMNHKELIAKIALKMNLPKQDIENLLAATIETCTEQLR
ncbi:MAG: hypothetical protein Q7U47_04880, partial [Paludibacter sp.]|nr:hypothetical protein [Paludibacter sp.]